MKRRKRRRTMRPPSDPAEEAAHMQRYKRRSSETKICVNGICSVHPQKRLLPFPTGFSDSDKAEHLACTVDGLKVSYVGPGRDEKDAASVRTNNPIPTKGLALYYFEITVLDQGDTGRIGVGLCAQNVKLGKMPGWEEDSFAYHGDDGLLFRQTGNAGAQYGPKYGTDDVIGCCWDQVDNTVFFTKNGKNLGPAFNNLSGSLYPTIGMQSTKGRIRANFGRNRFLFDIEAHAHQQRQKILNSITERKLPTDYRILSDTVLSYLMHNGYSLTAAAFAKDAGREAMYEQGQESMLKRKVVCDMVVAGDIDGAMLQLEEEFPQVLKTQVNVRFLLMTQKFIEMIVSGASSEETVEYGREKLRVFQDKDYLQAQEAAAGTEILNVADSSIQYEETLRDVYSLLAYRDPAESPMGYLTKQNRREVVADKLNSAILATQKRPMRSILERFLSHTESIISQLLRMENGPAALVAVQDLL